MRSRCMGLQFRRHRLQSDAAAEAVGGVGMSAPRTANSTAAGGPSRSIFAIATISQRLRAGNKRPPIGTFLQRPARRASRQYLYTVHNRKYNEIFTHTFSQKVNSSTWKQG